MRKTFVEVQNKVIHEVYMPTRKQLFAAFETVTVMVVKMKNIIDQTNNVLRKQQVANDLLE